jgi:DHA1 family tetracycline resistance protein-like MFS transporter
MTIPPRPRLATYLFIYCGLISAFVQGGMIGRVVKKLGEPKVITLSLMITATAWPCCPLSKVAACFLGESSPDPKALLGGVARRARPAGLGSSLTRPPLFGLLSNLTAANEQGANIGVAQGAGSLARIIGQFSAPIIFLELPRHYALFLGCAAILLLTSLVVTFKSLPGKALNFGKSTSRTPPRFAAVNLAGLLPKISLTNFE